MTTKQKIEALRGLMKERGLDAYLIPTTDAHQSEYVPACWQRRAWSSGFTGSAGDLVVTRDEAGLWTDGRYFLQAASELRGSGIRLYKMGQHGVPTIQEFLAKKLTAGQVVGIDPRVVSLDRAGKLEKALQAESIELRMVEPNLVDELWIDRPSPSIEPIRVLPRRFAGESVSSKLRRLRSEMKKKRVDAHVLSALDAVAWLYNIRGRDIEFNPVVIAYALVTAEKAILFTDPVKVPAAEARKLGSKIEVRAYEAVAEALRELSDRKVRVWVEPSTTSRWLGGLLADCELIRERSPVTLMKARKNPAEIEGMKECHVRDGVAMVRFLRWLEEEVPRGGLTEISASDRLAELRAEGDLFQGLSFDTISGYADHGAIIHYRVTPKTDRPLKPDGVYLIDSGGQYLDGTTDITRTVLLGKKASREVRDRFTRVLKGHIALARARFPEGVTGIRLDTLARLPLWEAELDYNHGTGHGVGAYLNVHEGPRSISPTRDLGLPLEPGNIFSNEPGYYKPGEYGIRIESLILVTENGGPSENGKPYFQFETITLCPIDTRLIDRRLLDPAERKWLDGYHRMVYKKLSPRLSPADRSWLKKACAPV